MYLLLSGFEVIKIAKILTNLSFSLHRESEYIAGKIFKQDKAEEDSFNEIERCITAVFKQ
jgi:hypothetical protein